MSKVTVNKLTGHDYFKARSAIGLAISKTAEMTGLNRNKLSQFEQVKGSLSASEKKALKRFYEERGYDFGEPENVDNQAIGETYLETHEITSEAIKELMPNAVGEALIELIDAQADVQSFAAYLSEYNHDKAVEAESILSSKSGCEESQALCAELVKHFEADKDGGFKNKGGFLGGAAHGRGRKLVGILAYTKLKELAAEFPDLFETSLSKVTQQTDNRRMLSELSGLLEDNHDEFKQVESSLIA